MGMERSEEQCVGKLGGKPGKQFQGLLPPLGHALDANCIPFASRFFRCHMAGMLQSSSVATSHSVYALRTMEREGQTPGKPQA